MYVYRLATKQDIARIVELVESAYRGEKSRVGWTTEADLLDGQRTDYRAVAEIIKTENDVIIVCEQNSRLLASVHLKKMPDYAYLGMFAVKPELQGKGVGKALLQYAEKLSKDWACKYIEMTVITQRLELINWYQRQGYVLSGEKREFPYGDERYGIPRRDDLEMTVLVKKIE